MTFLVCDNKLMVMYSKHFFAYGFLWRAIIVISSKSLVHSPVDFIQYMSTFPNRGIPVSSPAGVLSFPVAFVLIFFTASTTSDCSMHVALSFSPIPVRYQCCSIVQNFSTYFSHTYWCSMTTVSFLFSIFDFLF